MCYHPPARTGETALRDWLKHAVSFAGRFFGGIVVVAGAACLIGPFYFIGSLINLLYEQYRVPRAFTALQGLASFFVIVVATQLGLDLLSAISIGIIVFLLWQSTRYEGATSLLLRGTLWAIGMFLAIALNMTTWQVAVVNAGIGMVFFVEWSRSK